MLSKKAPPFVPRCTPGFAAEAGNTNPVYPIIHSLHTVCNPPGVTALQNPHECLTKQTAPSTMKVQQKAPLQSACRAKKMAGRCLLEKGGVPHWAAFPAIDGKGSGQDVHPGGQPSFHHQMGQGSGSRSVGHSDTGKQAHGVLLFGKWEKRTEDTPAGRKNQACPALLPLSSCGIAGP